MTMPLTGTHPLLLWNCYVCHSSLGFTDVMQLHYTHKRNLASKQMHVSSFQSHSPKYKPLSQSYAVAKSKKNLAGQWIIKLGGLYGSWGPLHWPWSSFVGTKTRTVELLSTGRLYRKVNYTLSYCAWLCPYSALSWQCCLCLSEDYICHRVGCCVCAINGYLALHSLVAALTAFLSLNLIMTVN